MTDVEQARLVRIAIDRLLTHCSAKKVSRLVVNEGLNHSEVREFVDEDGALQVRAATELLDRLGVTVSKSANNGTQIGSLTVHVHKVQPPAPLVVDAQVTDIVE